MTRRSFRVAVTGLLALALALTASPSYAATRKFQDTVGDTDNHGLFDISKVTVKNTAKYVSVKFQFPANDYVPGPDGHFEVLLDTDAKKPGAELSWSAPLFSEFSIVPVRGGKRLHKKEWLPATPKPTKCGKTVRVDWNPQKGYGRLKIFRKAGCVGKTPKMRVSVKTVATGERKTWNGEPIVYDHPEVDRYPNRRLFSAWVRR
jgi:hypothetical protein